MKYTIHQVIKNSNGSFTISATIYEGVLSDTLIVINGFRFILDPKILTYSYDSVCLTVNKGSKDEVRNTIDILLQTFIKDALAPLLN